MLASPASCADVRGDQPVIPRDELGGDTQVNEGLERGDDPGPKRVVEDHEPDECHARLIFLADLGLRPDVPHGHAQSAQALLAKFDEEPFNPRSERGQLDDFARRRFDRRADLQHVGQRALGHEQVSTLSIDQDAEALADEVVRLLVELPIGRRRRTRLGADRRVDRVGVSRLERGVEIREEPDPIARPSLGIDHRPKPDFTLSQRTGLVRAEHIHAAQVLDGGQPAHDHCARGPSAARPCARFTLMIAGSSCGVSPTAIANAKRNDSRTGR